MKMKLVSYCFPMQLIDGKGGDLDAKLWDKWLY
jgi:hypothetical protein